MGRSISIATCLKRIPFYGKGAARIDSLSDDAYSNVAPVWAERTDRAYRFR